MNFIFVADFSKMGNPSEGKDVLAAENTVYISKNVYLFCASEGLATVTRGMVDRSTLSKVMKLRADQRIAFGQSVGYPKK